jgi:hypothetical protein
MTPAIILWPVTTTPMMINCKVQGINDIIDNLLFVSKCVSFIAGVGDTSD